VPTIEEISKELIKQIVISGSERFVNWEEHQMIEVCREIQEYIINHLEKIK